MRIVILLHKLRCAKTDPEYGQALGQCMDHSRVSQAAWEAVVANLTKMCPWTLHTILGGSKDYLLRAEADVVEELPTVSCPFQLGVMMHFFRGLYPEMGEEMREKLFKWAKRSLRSSRCQAGKSPSNGGLRPPPSSNDGQSPPRPSNDGQSPQRPDMNEGSDGGSACGLSWVNKDTVALLGIFIMQASNRDFAQVRAEQVCDLIEESDFLARLTEAADDLPDRVKHVMDMLQTQCGDKAQLRNISRSGPLACYMSNMDSMDAANMEKRLTKLRGCKNKDAMKNIAGLVRELAKKKPVDREMLRSMGASASALTSRQIANISDGVILDTIVELGEGREWSRGQSRDLVRKYLRGGGKVKSGSDLVQMGSLVRGLRSGTLRNVSGPELLRAARGGLEDEAQDMSPFQRGTIVGTILAGVNTTDAIESLSGSLLLVVPLSALVAADVGSLTNITRKQWNVAQALYLCTIVFNNGSMTHVEFSELGALTQGVTCKELSNYADQFGTQLGLALGNATWLSRNQLTCAGQKMRDIVMNLPAGTTAEEIRNLAESLPSCLLLYIGEEAIARLYGNDCPGFLSKMSDVKMECLPRSSPVRGQLLERAVGCLGDAMSTLDGAGVRSMGALVCEFTGTNVTQLTDAAFNASIPLLAKCRQFEASARSVLATRLVQTLGPASQWSVDTVRSLGSLLTLR
ncbi:uncharacterized protein LOC129715629 [Leucoraja erinacea]|uniref:uncharacterized protein LOC129715629 n=1 Tax=Leucoraja erinaceus TaxID=7782 RepID=UPI0024559445|nr:uncharacterized protein LOC129715629 [Leucoraja erinacea]